MTVRLRLLCVVRVLACAVTLLSSADGAASLPSVRLPGGDVVSWTVLQGHVLILAFQNASAPCGADAAWRDVAFEYADRHVTYVQVRPGKARSSACGGTVQVPLALDPGRQLARLYGVRRVPTVVLVDASGRVRARLMPPLSGARLLRTLQPLLP